MALEFAEAMEVDLDRHILRQENYKGSRRQISEQSLRLPFDGWTLPAVYVVVADLDVSCLVLCCGSLPCFMRLSLHYKYDLAVMHHR